MQRIRIVLFSVIVAVTGLVPAQRAVADINCEPYCTQVAKIYAQEEYAKDVFVCASSNAVFYGDPDVEACEDEAEGRKGDNHAFAYAICFIVCGVVNTLIP